MRKNQATIEEISKISGFSPMTVSRALRGHSNVKDLTRQKILGVAGRLGHGGQTGGLLSPKARSGQADHRLRLLCPYFTQTKNYEETELGQRLFSGLVGRLGHGAKFARKDCLLQISDALELVRQFKPHGVLLRQKVPSEWIQQLRKKTAVVYVAPHDFQSGVDSVLTNERRATQTIFHFLWESAHRNVLWLAVVDRHSPFELEETAFTSRHFLEAEIVSANAVRHAAWAHAVRLINGRNSKNLLQMERDWANETLMETLEKGIKTWEAMKPRPTAIVVAGDTIARPLLQVLKARGWAVPEDVSVVSYGDTSDAICEHPFLTTIRLPLEAIGGMVPELIERRLASPNAPALSLQVDGHLVVRETVGPAPKI